MIDVLLSIVVLFLLVVLLALVTVIWRRSRRTSGADAHPADGMGS